MKQNKMIELSWKKEETKIYLNGKEKLEETLTRIGLFCTITLPIYTKKAYKKSAR